jgi:hypothetical protein
MDVRLDSAHRAFYNELHSDGGREVKDYVALIDQFGGHWMVVHGIDGVMKSRVIL